MTWIVKCGAENVRDVEIAKSGIADLAELGQIGRRTFPNEIVTFVSVRLKLESPAPVHQRHSQHRYGQGS